MAGRLAFAYLAVFAISAGLAATSFTIGSGRHAEPKVAGTYTGSAPCLGGQAEFTLKQSGQFIDASGGFSGALRFRHNRLTGTVDCKVGDNARIAAERIGGREDPTPSFRGTLGGEAFEAKFARDLPKITAAPPHGHSNEQIFGRLMLAIASVILAARLVRYMVGRVGQPPVMGEVLAGILLGPTLFGAVWPSFQHYLFPSFVVPLLGAGANIGLAFYMFLVGLELDPRQLKGRIAHAAAISNASIVFPLGLGIIVALPLYTLLGPPGKNFQSFALFMGVAMSITAFPVLARILIERRMLKRPIGALTLSAAAVDDVTAWGLLAIASAVAGHGSAVGALPVLGYVFAFCAVMALLARPLLNRVSAAYDEAGRVPAGWIAAIFVGVLLASYASMEAGVAPIFGAFVFGLVMPRRADLSHDVTSRLEDFVSTVLLPLFFVVTGLKTDVGLLNQPVLWLVALVLLAVAIVGKWVGAAAIARMAGYRPREAAVIGTLMNTRGLTELIVLNIGLELGVISPALFTMLVLMALVTTFMAAPLLHLLDPKGELSAPIEEELHEVEGEVDPAPTILVAPLEERNVAELLALAEPLARAERRELLLVRLIEPPRVAISLAANDRELDRARLALTRLRESLIGRGIPTRTLALTSPRRGRDLARIAAEQGATLILVDGRRPLLGPKLPKGEVGETLEDATCDVAVLVEREVTPAIDADHPVVVLFRGDEDDQSALELGGHIAGATGAPLRVVGPTEVDEAVAGAGLLIVGLGATPPAAAVPVLFVRRAAVSPAPSAIA